MIRRAYRAARLWFTLALALGLTPVATAQDDLPPNVATRDDATLGSILNDPSGWTVYSFTSDGPEASACVDQCAVTWPSLLVDGAAAAPPDLPGTLSAFPRADGSMQAAYNLAPLYYYSGDQQPGDTNGQGIGGSWFAANSGLAPSAPPAAPVSQPTPTAQPLAPTAQPTPPVDSTAAPAATAAPQPTRAPAPTAAPAPYQPAPQPMPMPRPGY